MKSKALLIIGMIVILLGILFMGPSLGMFSLTKMWPAFILLSGIGFFIFAFAYPKLIGLLMPASILTISSIPLFMSTFTGNWEQMARLWPVFLLSVAIGFFLMYFRSRGNKGLLISGLIIIAIAIVGYLIFNYIRFLFPILFIAGGLILIFIGLAAKKKEKKIVPPAQSPDESVQQ